MKLNGLLLDDKFVDAGNHTWAYAKNILLSKGFSTIENEKGDTNLQNISGIILGTITTPNGIVIFRYYTSGVQRTIYEYKIGGLFLFNAPTTTSLYLTGGTIITNKIPSDITSNLLSYNIPFEGVANIYFDPLSSGTFADLKFKFYDLNLDITTLNTFTLSNFDAVGLNPINKAIINDTHNLTFSKIVTNVDYPINNLDILFLNTDTNILSTIFTCNDIDSIEELNYNPSIYKKLYIEGVHNYDKDGNLITIWTTGYHPPMILNITEAIASPITISNYTDLTQYFLFPKLNALNFTYSITDDGMLPIATYQLAMCYELEDGSLTNFQELSTVIPISSGKNENVSLKESSKSINVLCSGLDTGYSKLRFAIIQRTDSSTNCYITGIYNFLNSNKEIKINSLSLLSTFDIDTVLVNHMDFQTIGTLAIANNRLRIANLTDIERKPVGEIYDALFGPTTVHLSSLDTYENYTGSNTLAIQFLETNIIPKVGMIVTISGVTSSYPYLEPYINRTHIIKEIVGSDIIINMEGTIPSSTLTYNITSAIASINLYSIHWSVNGLGSAVDFSDLTFCANFKGFKLNEVYSLYIGIKLKNGNYYGIYHIPGRVAITDTEVADSSYEYNDGTSCPNFAYQSSAYKFTTASSETSGYLGYWENQNYNYANKYGTFLGNDKIRHHRMPRFSILHTDYNKSTIGLSTYFDLTNFANLVGESVYNNVACIEIFYAKRDFNNQIVLDQGLVDAFYPSTASKYLRYYSLDTFKNIVQLNPYYIHKFADVDSVTDTPGLYNINTFKVTNSSRLDKVVSMKYAPALNNATTPSNENGTNCYITEIISSVNANSTGYINNLCDLIDIKQDVYTDIDSAILIKTNKNQLISNYRTDAITHFGGDIYKGETSILKFSNYFAPTSAGLTAIGTTQITCRTTVQLTGTVYYLTNWSNNIFNNFYALASSTLDGSTYLNTLSRVYSKPFTVNDVAINGFLVPYDNASRGIKWYNFWSESTSNGFFREEGSNLYEKCNPYTIASDVEYVDANEKYSNHMLDAMAVARIYNNVIYNNSFNFLADLQKASITTPTTSLANIYKSRIYSSQLQAENSNINNFRIFAPLDYYDLINEKGGIYKVLGINTLMFIITEYSVFKSYIIDQLSTEELDVSLKTTDIFDRPPSDMFEGNQYCIAANRDACIMTPFGLAIVDNNKGSIYIINEEVKEISASGIENWFRNIIKNKASFLEKDTWFNTEDPNNHWYGDHMLELLSGIVLGYDDINKRLLVTIKSKKEFKDTGVTKASKVITAIHDYTTINPGDSLLTLISNNATIPNYCLSRTNGVIGVDVNYYPVATTGTPIVKKIDLTLSFSLEHSIWVAFHSYIPNKYISNSNGLFNIIGNKINKMLTNNFGYYSNIYGQHYYSSAIDFIFNSNTESRFLLKNIKWVTNIEKDNINYWNETINKLLIYSKNLCTAEYTISKQQYNYTGSNITQTGNTLYRDGEWLYNDFKNYLLTSNSRFLTDYFELISTAIDNDVTPTLAWNDRVKLIGKYIIIRLLRTNTSANKYFKLYNISIDAKNIL